MLILRSTGAGWYGPGSYHEASKRAVFQGEYARDGLVFLSFAIVITLMRTYSRWTMVGFRKFQADDCLVWFALALYIAETINDNKLVLEYRGLTNDGMSDEARVALDPDSEEYRLRVGGSILHLAAWPMYVLLLWSLKTAMAVFYLRLMDHLDTYRRKIHIGFALIGVTFMTVILVPFLSCIPTSKMWQINPDPGILCYPESSPAILWTVLACNIVTDAYLLWLPMPMLFQSTLPRVTKIALMLLFGCGIFVTAAAAMTIIFVVTRQEGDFHNIGFWAARETFVAILTTNLPSVFVLLRRWLKPSLVFLRSHSTGAAKPGGGGGGGVGVGSGSGLGGSGSGGAGGSPGDAVANNNHVGSRHHHLLHPSRTSARRSRLLLIGGGGGGGSTTEESGGNSGTKINVTTTITSNSTTAAPQSSPTLHPRPSKGLLWGSFGVGGMKSSTKGAGGGGGGGRWKSSGHLHHQQQQQAPETFSMKRIGTAYSTTEKSASQEHFLVLNGQEGSRDSKQQYHHPRQSLGDAFDGSDYGGGRSSSGSGSGSDGHEEGVDNVSSLRSSGNGPGGAGKVTTIAHKVSTRLQRSTGISSSSSAQSDAPRAASASAIHQVAEGVIQKHVEISISKEPTAAAAWGVDKPAEAYTITRAYNEPAEPDPVHHHHHHHHRLGKS